MEVYMSPAEFHYFMCGEPCMAFSQAPNIAVVESILFTKVLIYKDEVVKHLFSGRMMIQKKY